MSSFIRILKYTLNYKLSAVLNVLFNLLHVIFSIASLAMIIPFLKLLFEQTSENEITDPGAFTLSVDWIIDYLNFLMKGYIEAGGSKEVVLFYLCIFIIVIFLLKNVFRYLALYVMAPLRYGVIKDLRTAIFDKILELPISYFSEERKGDIITRASSDVQEIEWSILQTLEILFKEPLMIAGYLVVLFYTSPMLSVFVLVLLPLGGLLIGQIGKTLKKQSSEGQSKLGNIISLLEETITGLRIVKAFNAEAFQREKFDKENQSYYHLYKKVMRRRDLSSPLSEFMGISIVVIVLWFGGKLVLDTEPALEPATFIFFIVVFSQIINPVKSFSTAYYFVQKGVASIERVEKILNAKTDIRETTYPKPIHTFTDSIEFRNVFFSYGKENVLKDINIKIEKGKTIAVVGLSGAGKSTLVDLIPRFYDITAGEILIDGTNIKEYMIKNLRSLMGIVTQESILFNDTVFNNIAFGAQNVKEEDVINAAKVANAHNFIDNLDKKYHTNIGERGSKLSGGERQRLTIARALLKNPPILILDEATSSLDTESEKLVQDALLRLMENRTSIVIAHRLSTIQHADDIIVLDNKKIAERGNHQSLIEQNGLYRKLIEMQNL